MTSSLNHAQVPLTARAELSAEQVGHLRHFANLLRQPINDWSFMKGKGLGQDDFGGYRFQLAYMTYALALAHMHRLPAAPGLFKPLFEKAIEKMLHPDVWIYWKDTSRGGAAFNAHLSDNYQEQYNPVVKDNIMYSAYVQSMTLLFNYLFDDDRYSEPGAITFSFYTPFWGGGEKRFEYDQNTLNEHVYWLMVETGYLGVACEPNCVFQICNQPAILGFRLHDLLTGEAVADEVTKSYEQAWEQFGRLDENGHYNTMISEIPQVVVPNATKTAWVDAWCGTLMNMWNRDFVRSNYPAQIEDIVDRYPDGRVAAGQPNAVAGEPVVGDSGDFGWTAAWASEMGDETTLNGLLAHAERFMNPTYMKGGLYYPRNDTFADADGNRVEVDPMTGNVLLGYARLNVKDGLWKLYNEPRRPGQHSEPGLIAIATNVDVSRAYFDGEKKELVFTVQRRSNLAGDGVVQLGNLAAPGSRWTLRDADGVEMTGDDDAYALNLPDDQKRSYSVVFGH
jgi:Linalool dehydratase/isomerase